MPESHSAALPHNAALVHDFLHLHDGPATAYQILDGLRSCRVCAPLTVYRALEQLVAHGLAHCVESLNVFVACSHPRHAEGSLVTMACAPDQGAQPHPILNHRSI
ncbi:MAG: hypothetical protein HOI34_02235 [Rhodospirillaceae bacterium]|nr:hypothetical protein [Rhodospirillaceae bacterium]MBT6202501.1 hypothetical protein [Rhodospirillaceae bacterium]MBT6511290.1 hypothetical protein [Rhodospirillaceae bacterium]